MKRRVVLPLFAVIATAALGQPHTAPNQSATRACPPPPAGKTAWFDTCSYLMFGDGVRPGHALYAPNPQYSEPGRQAKIKGQVLLAIAVNAEGTVDSVKIVRSLEPSLDQNAVAAVKTWKFTPATKDDKPVPVQFEAVIKFDLY